VWPSNRRTKQRSKASGNRRSWRCEGITTGRRDQKAGSRANSVHPRAARSEQVTVGNLDYSQFQHPIRSFTRVRHTTVCEISISTQRSRLSPLDRRGLFAPRILTLDCLTDKMVCDALVWAVAFFH
jgi:hypothetical protein